MKLLADLEANLKRKGLQSGTPYPAIVTDNNDPAKLQRVQARIEKFHDHLEDSELPWFLPKKAHNVGLISGGLGRTGSCAIPATDAAITIYFPSGDPQIGQYTNERPVDEKLKIDEFDVNYPHRTGYVLPNGYTFIIDMKTNEVFLETPGDANITVLGDTNLTTVGNISLKATSTESKIPGYLRGAPERVLSQLRPTPQKEIEFEGLYGGDSGNIHLEADGHITANAGKKIKLKSASDTELDVGANLTEKVSSNIGIKAGGKYEMKSGGAAKMKAPRIDLN